MHPMPRKPGSLRAGFQASLKGGLWRRARKQDGGLKVCKKHLDCPHSSLSCGRKWQVPSREQLNQKVPGLMNANHSSRREQGP